MASSLFQQYEEEGNAAELEFGKEVNVEYGTRFLSNEEAYYLLHVNHSRERLMMRRENDLLDAGSGRKYDDIQDVCYEVFSNESVVQTKKYLDHLATTKDCNTILTISTNLNEALKNLLLVQRKDGEKSSLHPFEIAQIATLLPQNCEVEEAIAWLPSLARFEDHEIQTVLDLVTKSKLSLYSSIKSEF